MIEEYGTCLNSPDGTHCEHWWDGEGACCYCEDNDPVIEQEEE